MSATEIVGAEKSRAGQNAAVPSGDSCGLGPRLRGGFNFGAEAPAGVERAMVRNASSDHRFSCVEPRFKSSRFLSRRCEAVARFSGVQDGGAISFIASR